MLNFSKNKSVYNFFLSTTQAVISSHGLCVLNKAGYLFIKERMHKMEKRLATNHEENNKKAGLKYDPVLIVVTLLIIAAFVTVLAMKPESTLTNVTGVFDTVIKYFGSILELLVFGFVIIAFYFGLGKYGKIKLGDDDPEYSMFSYISMMLMAAIASAALYWSFTEWAAYYENPGLGIEARTTEAAEISLGYQLFHWGLSGQAIYVMIGVAMSYAFYNRKVPLLQTSSVCKAMMGNLNDKAKNIIGKIIDFAVLFGIIGGLGCTLGLGIPLTAGALIQLWGIEITFPIQVGIIVFIALIFTFTSFLGMKKGMRNISNISVGLTIGFRIYVLIAGPTDFILKNTVSSLGWMIHMFPRMSTFTDPISNSGFPEAWTMYFQAFYLNYAAMMGIFIAKVSKGRTIREVTWATLFGISAGGWVLFCINGSFSIFSHFENETDVVELMNSGHGETGIYQIIALLPGGEVILPFVFLVIIIGFIAAVLDAASLSLAQTTATRMEADGEVSKWMRVFWCVILALIPLSIMFVKAEFTALKILSILISVPFLFIILFMVISTFRWLKEDEDSGVLEKFGIFSIKKHEEKKIS